MATLFAQHSRSFNPGERALHERLHVPHRENPTNAGLNPYGQMLIRRAPLIALGALDTQGRPWSTVWGGEEGFSSVIDRDILGMRALVARDHDPVITSLFKDSKGADVSSFRATDQGKMISGLTIDLENRNRVKLHGKAILGTLAGLEDEEGSRSESVGSRGFVQLVMHVEESLGNCPKYLHKKHIIPTVPYPQLISASPQLPLPAVELIHRADCFFISSFHQNTDMDTNYRGGPAGFVRIVSNQPQGAVLVYPEYSGNRLYQSLGNMMMNNKAGLVFPDFETGDAVYMTVTTEVLINADADAVLPRSNLAVRMTIIEARYVEKALGFKAMPIDKSPYTPTVRYLRSEKGDSIFAATDTSARLISKQILTPTIARFRFKLSSANKNVPTYEPGQYTVFSFKEELDTGYIHMRDDDPLSLNDDYIRTFTVSSFPGSEGLPDDEFEITVRKSRRATSYLFQWNPRVPLEIPLLGFGGTFKINTSLANGNQVIPFIAGGIGITPLLGQLPGLDLSHLRLLWSISVVDIGLVEDLFRLYPGLANSSTLFLSQLDNSKQEVNLKLLEGIEATGATIRRRRLSAEDVKSLPAETFYLCSGQTLRSSVLEWLKGKKVIYEDFTY